MRTIFLAGPMRAKKRLQWARERIQEHGLGKVVSSWLDHADGDTIAKEPAIRDLNDIRQCDTLILDLIEHGRQRAYEVEWGYHLGRVTTKMLEGWIVGKPTNIYHALATYTFENWVDVLYQLQHGVPRAETSPHLLP